MTKKKRSDFQLIGEITFEGFKIKVLGDAHTILESQGHLALTSAFHHNRQDYGPFRVTVTALGSLKKKETKNET